MERDCSPRFRDQQKTTQICLINTCTKGEILYTSYNIILWVLYLAKTGKKVAIGGFTTFRDGYMHDARLQTTYTA